MPSSEYDVIVAGYGPVGATLANLLGARGIRTLVLEREDGVYRLPRAGTCDDEVMRIWQSVGLADDLLPHFLPQHKIEFFDGSGRKFMELGRTAGFGYGYPPLLFLYQPYLEQKLREGVERFPSVEVRLRHEVASLEQSQEMVTVAGRETRSGQPFRVTGKYLIGCDGGRSTVREALGIELAGRTFSEWLVVDAKVEDPTRFPANFQFICNPKRPCTTYPMAFNHHRWQWKLKRGESREQMEAPEVAQRFLAPWPAPKEVIRRAVYIYHARLATRWRVGRVFLAGDAAHLTPPFAGQGMSSGLRDVSNLAWKLALVLRGQAGDELLETYERERHPHVKKMTGLSLTLTAILQTENRALAFARDTLLRLLGRAPVIGRFVRSGEFKPAAALHEGFVAGGRRRGSGAADGTLLIQPRVETGDGQNRLLDEVLGDGFAVLGLNVDPRRVIDQSSRPLWDGLSTRFVRVVPAGGEPIRAKDGEVVIDLDGQLARWFKRHRANVVVLRPDHFVFDSGDIDDPATAPAFVHRLRHALGSPSPSARPRSDVQPRVPHA